MTLCFNCIQYMFSYPYLTEFGFRDYYLGMESSCYLSG